MQNIETTETPALAPEVICGKSLLVAQESLSIVITLLLSQGGGQTSPKTFYAHFLMNMNIQWVGPKHQVQTMGVSITDKVNLYISPTFFNKLNTAQQGEVLEHEIEHIVFMHPLRAKDYISTEKNAKGRHKCANIAMDANINENKPTLMKFSEGFVTIARLNAQLKEIGSKDALDIKDPWEVHYEKLMKAAKENPDQGGEGSDGFGDPVDDHSIWGESTANKEVAEGIIKNAANKAQASTGAGNMPENMLREIANMNKSTVNWKRELRQFFTNALTYDFTKTRNRRNRRYGVVQPGRKKKPNLHIAVCVDSSGSVSDSSFTQFFAEIVEISEMGVEITVLDADCEVQSVYKFDKKKQVKRSGQGGTMYQPAITKAKELGVDGIIYFGDADSADTPVDPKLPFLWAIVGNQTAPGNFGRTIRVLEEKK